MANDRNVYRVKFDKDKMYIETDPLIEAKVITLTDEQMEKLGLKKKSPFDRANICGEFLFIESTGVLNYGLERDTGLHALFYDTANYCTDRELLQQRAWHETLSRLLWRWGHMNDAVPDKYDPGFRISYSEATSSFHKTNKAPITGYFGEVTFRTEKLAERAIKEVVEPFIAAHPEWDKR